MPAPVSAVTWRALRNQCAISVRSAVAIAAQAIAIDPRGEAREHGARPTPACRYRRGTAAGSEVSSCSSAYCSLAQRTASYASAGWKPAACSARSTVSMGSPWASKRECDPARAPARRVDGFRLTAPWSSRRDAPAALPAAAEHGGDASAATRCARRSCRRRARRRGRTVGAGEAAHDGGVRCVAGAEAECGTGFGDREVESGGVDVETVGEVAQQQERGRPERREPERLGVPTPGIVADHVHHRIGPGHHPDRGRHTPYLLERHSECVTLSEYVISGVIAERNRQCRRFLTSAAVQIPRLKSTRAEPMILGTALLRSNRPVRPSCSPDSKPPSRDAPGRRARRICRSPYFAHGLVRRRPPHGGSIGL